MNPRTRLFTIKEVSNQIDVPKHTLRFWEREFNEFIIPHRTNGGQRRYTPENIDILLEVKRLRQSGMGLNTIEQILKEKILTPHPTDTDQDIIDLLADKVAEAVKAEIYRLFKCGNQNSFKENKSVSIK